MSELATSYTVTEKAHIIRESISMDLEAIEQKFLEVGAKLILIRDLKLWKELGHKDIEEFWQQTYKRGRSTLYDFMGVAEEFGRLVSEGRLPMLTQTHLVALLPLLRGRSDEEKIECIQRVSELGPRDFDDELRAMKGKPSALDCAHEHEVIIAKCVKCHSTRKISQT